VKVNVLSVVPALAVAAAAVVLAPNAKADCNTVTGSTLCASGTVSGSSGAPTSVPRYSPYPCYGNPTCDYYDIYDPGISWDLPSLGGGNNRPRPQPR
jgi:hypothetical protein